MNTLASRIERARKRVAELDVRYAVRETLADLPREDRRSLEERLRVCRQSGSVVDLIGFCQMLPEPLRETLARELEVAGRRAARGPW